MAALNVPTLNVAFGVGDRKAPPSSIWRIFVAASDGVVADAGALATASAAAAKSERAPERNAAVMTIGVVHGSSS